MSDRPKRHLFRHSLNTTVERATSTAGVAEPAMSGARDFYLGREHAKMKSGAIVLAATRHKPIGVEVALSDSAATQAGPF